MGDDARGPWGQLDRSLSSARLVSCQPAIAPGDRIAHSEFGPGVVLEAPRDGFVRAFFSWASGASQRFALRRERSRAERILASVSADPARRCRRLGCLAGACAAADGERRRADFSEDRLAAASGGAHPSRRDGRRRAAILIADEVGLGKTIETALILRELASRGELTRALMVVPAGLVNNWHRELNEVFNLDFEVFGSEGDVTDRKSNAFAKHDRLIASIDTLKRPGARQAPARSAEMGFGRVRRGASPDRHRIRRQAFARPRTTSWQRRCKHHTRDLLLLSATPHQGNHFPFWMLIQLLNPTLFNSPEEMVEHRHRLNSVMFRRTKADACQPDGSPLFARRVGAYRDLHDGRRRAAFLRTAARLSSGRL